MSTLETRKMIADLIERGNDPKVGYYHSSCVIFGHPDDGGICADPKGYALIGKIGDPVTAVTKFKDMEKALPESNPGCVRGAFVLAELLEVDPFLVLNIWTSCGIWHDGHTKRDEAVADHLKLLRREADLPRSHFTSEMEQYLERIGKLQPC